MQLSQFEFEEEIMDYSRIFKTVSPSIVNVVQLDDDNSFCSTASGVLIADGSKVLTCFHCVDPNFKNGILIDKSTNLVQLGDIVFADKDNDVAILDLHTVVGAPSTIVSSSSMEIGNEIFTIGFPYSFKSEKTLTTGNIAAFENELIKIDTSVNNGNSGGPLFNINGEVIGIVNAKLGSLSKFLEDIEKANPQAFMQISGIDPVKTIQQMLREMKKNLNLGIGYAIPSDKLANISSYIKSIIK